MPTAFDNLDIDADSGPSRHYRRRAGGCGWVSLAVLAAVLSTLGVGAYLLLTYDPYLSVVKEHWRTSANDPGSMEVVSSGPAQKVMIEGKRGTAYRVRYRGKNALGAKVIDERVFIIRSGKVVESYSGEDWSYFGDSLLDDGKDDKPPPVKKASKKKP